MPIFQKRHYEAITKMLRTSEGVFSPVEIHIIAYQFALFFAEDNPRFDHEKFIAACNRLKDDGDLT